MQKTLNRHARATGSDQYVLLRSGQLVGAALCIFVKSSILSNIKNVEGSVKKTGMSGMAGNKGAVAIRMDYANTQLCFVTAHLAAGFANYEERNRDYSTIHHGLRFQRNRGIDNHDSVIWMGDFNYRIGLGPEKVRQMIRNGDLEGLYENDQLNLQMVAGLTFPYYSEARITFNPTYKYDLGTDTYDTSEKARIPAWTDRILRKGTNLRQINYNTASLRFSDHRPVYATFQCTVSIVDEARRESLSRELYERRRSEVGGTSANNPNDDSDDEDLIGYDAIEPGLPPASSGTRKWWLDNGQPARSNIQPPQKGQVLNPDRPSNPYTPTDEPDWVTIPRVEQPRRQVASSNAPPPPNPRSSSATTTNGARKLPPAFSPAISVSAITTSLAQNSVTDSSANSMSSRSSRPAFKERRLSASTSSSAGKKAPPPVARKPTHLTASPSSTSSPTVSTVSATSQSRPSYSTQKPLQTTVGHTGFAPPPRRTTAVGGSHGMKEIKDKRDVVRDATTPPPPPQARRAGRKGGTNGHHAGDASNDEGPRPSLPPRRATTDLLGNDDDSQGLRGWEALKPN